MRRFLVFLVCCWAGFCHADEKAGFEFNSVSVVQVISLYYREVVKTPYVICDAVLNDQRLVSIRASGRSLDEAMLGAVLGSYGYEARKDSGGVVQVCKKPEGVKAVADEALVYKPRNRSVSYLVDLASPLVKGTFANRRASPVAETVVPAPAGAARPGLSGQPLSDVGSSAVASMGTAADDVLVFFGDPKDCARLRHLLEQLDDKPLQVVVRAYLYDVGKGSSDASALNVLIGALKGRVTGNIGAQVTGGNALSLSVGGLDVVASALATDNRFKVVASPSLLLRSGGSSRLQVGSDQQVQSSQVTANGATTTGYEFKSAGVILDVSAKVFLDRTDINLTQTVSDFVPGGSASTGVTINTRQLRTDLSMVDGELVVIGGLQQQRVSGARSKVPFFGWVLGSQSDAIEDELVLVLEVKKV